MGFTLNWEFLKALFLALFSLFFIRLTSPLYSLVVVPLVIFFRMTHKHVPPSSQLPLVARIPSLTIIVVSTAGCRQIDLTSMLLKLNLSGLVPPQQLQKLDFAFLSDQFPLITFSLTFVEHSSNLTRSFYFHLRRLRIIRRSVSSSILPL